MTTYADIIKAEGFTGTPAEILALGNATRFVRSAQYEWGYGGLAKLFGHEAVGQIDEVLKAAQGYDWVRLKLASDTGLDFSDQETRRGLLELANKGIISPEMAAALSGLGGAETTIWAAYGVQTPSLSDIESALSHISAPQDFTQRHVLLSFNRSSTEHISVRVQEATAGGVVGDTLSALFVANGDTDGIPDAARLFIEAVRSAVDAYVETL